jgi:hypothetical protein
MHEILADEFNNLDLRSSDNLNDILSLKGKKMAFTNTDKSVPNLLTLGVNLATPSLILGAAIAIAFNDTIKHVATTSSITGAPWNKMSILSAALTMREVNNAVNNDDYTILGLIGAKAYSQDSSNNYYIEDGDGAPISMTNVLTAVAAMVLVLYFYHKSKVDKTTLQNNSQARTVTFS